MTRILAIFFGLILTTSAANASIYTHSAEVNMHSGGTDSSGCHHDHKRGGYHCH